MAPLVEEGLSRLASVARSAVVGVGLAGVVELAAVGDAQDDSTYRIASRTKPVTAVTTVLAARLAGVALDTPVRDVLPELSPDWSAHDGVTIAHVLAQTSGLSPSVRVDADPVPAGPPAERWSALHRRRPARVRAAPPRRPPTARGGAASAHPCR